MVHSRLCMQKTETNLARQYGLRSTSLTSCAYTEMRTDPLTVPLWNPQLQLLRVCLH